MGSKYGYAYRYAYAFTMVDEDEIQSKYKSMRDEGFKTFVFDVRTNFVLVPKKAEGEEKFVLIDSERFDALLSDPDSLDPDIGDPDDRSVASLCFQPGFRLREYWMSFPEILRFSRAALGFAQEMAADPQNACLSLIPMVVNFQVCTLQKEGESYEAAMNRAICSQRLLPLYLWRYPTITNDLCKPMSDYLKGFLSRLPRARNKLRLGQEWVCHFCSRRECFGDQITLLKCDHAFHSLCITRWLEDNNSCPKCGHQVYHTLLDK